MSVRRLALSSAPVEPPSRTPSSGETSKPNPERPVAAKSFTFGARKPRLTLPVILMCELIANVSPVLKVTSSKLSSRSGTVGLPARIQRIVCRRLAVIEQAVANAEMCSQPLWHERSNILREDAQRSILGSIRKTRAHVGDVSERERCVAEAEVLLQRRDPFVVKLRAKRERMIALDARAWPVPGSQTLCPD